MHETNLKMTPSRRLVPCRYDTIIVFIFYFILLFFVTCLWEIEFKMTKLKTGFVKKKNVCNKYKIYSILITYWFNIFLLM